MLNILLSHISKSSLIGNQHAVLAAPCTLIGYRIVKSLTCARKRIALWEIKMAVTFVLYCRPTWNLNCIELLAL